MIVEEIEQEVDVPESDFIFGERTRELKTGDVHGM